MSKKKGKNIKLSNYIKLFILFVIIVAVTFILRNLYISREENNLTTPIIRSVVTNEITANDFYSYISENETGLIYIGLPSNKECRKLEKDIKSYVNQNLKDKLIYLNLISIDEVKTFFNRLNSDYSYREVINVYPSFIYFKDGKIKDALIDNVSLDALKEFISSNNIL